MDFLFSAEQEAFRQKVKAFAEKEIAPIADELDERREFPLHIFRKLGQVGFLGIRYPEEYGGMGADLVTLCIFREELTCSSKGITGGVGVHIAIGTYPIYKFGSELQKQKYLIPAIRGEKISAFGLTEPDAGSHVAAIQTRATKSGSSYIINGSKIFITNSPIADFITVATRTSEGKGIEGIRNE
jgi:alkylation response protein AidB-like acyl-CoA dehydrogenase